MTEPIRLKDGMEISESWGGELECKTVGYHYTCKCILSELKALREENERLNGGIIINKISEIILDELSELSPEERKKRLMDADRLFKENEQLNAKLKGLVDPEVIG